jgi:alkylation response protein AidB-like acyl-CoA dehydrogenase
MCGPQLMGIETNPDHGGSGMSFTSAIIAIEELAKVDPSVSVLCDVHNTLVNTVVRKYGSAEQQEKWLPLLSESKVRCSYWYPQGSVELRRGCSSVPSVSLSRRLAPTRSR